MKPQTKVRIIISCLGIVLTFLSGSLFLDVMFTSLIGLGFGITLIFTGVFHEK